MQGSGVQAYIAAVKALTQNQLAWWQGSSRGHAGGAGRRGQSRYQSPLDVTVTAAGDTATGITLTNKVGITVGEPSCIAP